MGISPEITVRLRWDTANDCWRDIQTGVKVTGPTAPTPDLGPWPREPLQPDDAHTRHIREIVTPLIDEKFKTLENLRELIRDDWLPVLIERKLDERSAKTNMYFQQDRSKLATVGYLWEVVSGLSHEINVLERRLMVADRPWWKRWFRR